MRLPTVAHIVLALTGLLIAACPAPAAPRAFRPPVSLRLPSVPQADPALVALVRKMLRAQNQLTLAGTMVSQTPQGTFIQRAVLDGARAAWYDCESPAANRGEVIVDTGRARYHTTPSGRVDVLPSQMAARRVRVAQVIQEIRRGELIVQPVGQDVVAGHDCDIIRIGPPYAAESYQYWIDPTNGAQLRIEQYDAANRRVSATYFSDVTYNPPLDPHLFDAPRPAGATSRPPRPATLPSPPSAAQAGFTVLQPAYLPPGFRFQSSTITPRNGKMLVKLAYGNGMNALTLVETPDPNFQGPNAGLIRTPRPGVVLTRRYGLVIVLVGSLDAGIMENVLNSVR